MHSAVLRIDAATPAGRDRAVDVLRALAISGVVLGHWLVSAVVLQAGGHLGGDSPLHHMPAFTPVSWLLQPLAVFFLVGGRVGAHSYTAARRRGQGYRGWLAGRMRRLLRPAVPMVTVWGLVLLGLAVAGVAHETVHTLMWLAFSPLWFFGVYVVLTAATPLVCRYPGRVAVGAAVLVAALDLARALTGAAGWTETVRQANDVAGWLVPYALGAWWAAGGFVRRRYAAGMLAGGVLATVALVVWGGYPASMVGVPGQALSNLNPPTLAAVCFGLAQCGAALLLAAPLRRLVGQPGGGGPAIPAAEALRARPGQFVWAAVALLNLSAITVFLWHQTAMLTTTLVSLGLGAHLFALHTSPDTPLWPLARLGWCLLFALVLAGFLAAFRDWERGVRAGRSG
nr:acyltransferase [Streptomyces sp. SID5468]